MSTEEQNRIESTVDMDEVLKMKIANMPEGTSRIRCTQREGTPFLQATVSFGDGWMQADYFLHKNNEGELFLQLPPIEVRMSFGSLDSVSFRIPDSERERMVTFEEWKRRKSQTHPKVSELDSQTMRIMRDCWNASLINVRNIILKNEGLTEEEKEKMATALQWAWAGCGGLI